MKQPIYKTLKIKEDTHKLLKIYCAKNSLMINEWVDELIKEKIANHAKKINS